VSVEDSNKITAAIRFKVPVSLSEGQVMYQPPFTLMVWPVM